MKLLRRVFPYIRRYRGLFLATLAAAALTTLADLVPPWLIKTTIDDVIRASRSDLLLPVAAFLALAYAVKALTNTARIRLNNTFEQRVIFDIRAETYGALNRQSLTYFENRATGEIMSRVLGDVDNLERIFIDGIEHLLVAAMTLAGIAFVLFKLNWRLALIVLVPIPLLAVSAVFFTRRIHKLYHVIRQRLARLSALLQDNLSGVRETIAFNKQEYEMGRLAERSREYCEGNLAVARLWSLYSPGMVLLASTGTLLILLFGSRMVAAGTLSVGELVAFLAYAALFYAPINQIHTINHMVQHALAAGERVFEVIDAPLAIHESANPLVLKSRCEGYVRFDNVSFNYVDQMPVLRGVSFEMAPGEAVALVGSTGSGKTTIASLLVRFYDPDEGRITLDGYDIRHLRLKSLREQVALVRQEPFLFNGTIRENILYGADDPKSVSDDRLISVAQAACAAEFIERLPDAYDTWIGERGVKLSIGQKQRIAIARALLKDPPVLIFDEATSSVDTETEEKIQEAVAHLFARRTTLVIAHRLSTLRGVNRILVIDGGRIVEQGTHEELLIKGGVYAALFEGQLQL